MLNKEITLTVIAALLTLVGYSMNDTIVIFDRIRENQQPEPPGKAGGCDQQEREPDAEPDRDDFRADVYRRARVVPVWRAGTARFSLALVIGIIIGTYSSVFVASPIVLFWHDWADKRKKAAPAAPVVTAPRTAAGKPSVKASR
jgi:preprotein translocase subunit SecF